MQAGASSQHQGAVDVDRSCAGAYTHAAGAQNRAAVECGGARAHGAVTGQRSPVVDHQGTGQHRVVGGVATDFQRAAVDGGGATEGAGGATQGEYTGAGLGETTCAGDVAAECAAGVAGPEGEGVRAQRDGACTRQGGHAFCAAQGERGARRNGHCGAGRQTVAAAECEHAIGDGGGTGVAVGACQGLRIAQQFVDAARARNHATKSGCCAGVAQAQGATAQVHGAGTGGTVQGRNALAEASQVECGAAKEGQGTAGRQCILCPQDQAATVEVGGPCVGPGACDGEGACAFFGDGATAIDRCAEGAGVAA